ncbi:MAG: insulinase family protein, partial [Campylobacterales bacterium]|nr:insulinase family protein [Campylobacterales bacterium]
MKKILLALLLTVGLFGKDLTNDNSVVSGKLENGFTYYIKKNNLPKDSGDFNLIVYAGSMEEDDDQKGIAHLVEHMAFNGSTHFKKNQLIQTLESIGVGFGSHLNASTSYDRTLYTLRVPLKKDNLDKALLVFQDWAGGISFDQRELDKERGVVLEEARARNTLRYELFEQSKDHIYANSKYKDRTPIGDLDIIKNIKRDRVVDFYKDWYRPELMSFVAVGDFDLKEIERKIIKTFSDLKNTSNRKRPKREIPNFNKTRIYYKTSKELTSNSVTLSFIEDTKPITTEKQLRERYITSLANSLFIGEYKKRTAFLKESIYGRFISRPMQKIKMSHTFSVNVLKDDFKSSIINLNKMINTLRRNGFSKEDFQGEIKSKLKTLSVAYKKSKREDSGAIVSRISGSLVNESVFLSHRDSFELSTKLFRSITLDEVNKEFQRILKIKNILISVSHKKNIKAPSLKAIEKILEDKRSVHKSLQKKKLPKTISVGKIKKGKTLKESIDKDTGIRKLELSNGATVFLKNLPDVKNSISFKAISKGGLSKVKTKDIKNLSVGLSVSNSSGTGEFNSYQLSKIFKGKKFSLSRGVDRYTEYLRGSSAASDIEDLLKITYLDLLEVKIDDIAFYQSKISLEEKLKSIGKNPKDKFNREFTKFYYKNNLRVQQIELKDLKTLNKSKMKTQIEKRFKDPSNFIYIFTGSIDYKKLKPLIEKYIASLPSSKKDENYEDSGIRTVDGVHTFTRQYNNKNITDVTIISKFDTSFDYDKQLHVNAAGKILSVVLREKIREEKSGVYGVGVSAKVKRLPYEHGNLVVQFSCDPQRSDELISDVRTTIKKLLKNGIEKKHLDNYKKIAIVKQQQAKKKT